MSAATDLGFEHVFERGSGEATLLLLHATGGDEHQLVGLGRELAPDATLLSPRGQVLEHGVTRRFFARYSPAQLDVDDLILRADQLAEFVGAATDAYGLDPRHVVALGYSNGANIAAGLLLGRPGVLAGAALLRPMLPYEPDAPPALEGTNVLMAVGSSDPYAQVGRPERLAEILRTAGADVDYRVVETGHGLVDSDLTATRDWLQSRA